TGGSAQLRLTEDGEARPQTIPVAVRGAQLGARFVVKRPGGYRFVLGGGARPVQEADAHRIDIEPDRAPRVELYAPGGAELDVASTRRIELGYSLDDDYGLSELALVWKQGDAPEVRRAIPLRLA